MLNQPQRVNRAGRSVAALHLLLVKLLLLVVLLFTSSSNAATTQDHANLRSSHQVERAWPQQQASLPADRDRQRNLPEVLPIISSLIICRWSQLEPTQGVYDWTEVDGYMAAAIAEGLNYGFTFLVGPDAPAWLYEEGVPEVKTTNTGFDRFPYYFHPLCLESFEKAEQEVISYLMTIPAEWANSLVESN